MAPRDAIEDRSLVLTAAAVIYVATGLLYALPSIPLTLYIVREQALPVFAGIPFYQGSFFADQGMNWVIGASLAWIAVGILDIAIGIYLWNLRKIGWYLAVVAFVIVMTIAVGGEAPYVLIIEPIKLLLVWIGRPSLAR